MVRRRDHAREQKVHLCECGVALERFGRCDVVINNAGAIEVGPIESIDIDKVCSMVRGEHQVQARSAALVLVIAQDVADESIMGFDQGIGRLSP
jgi:NADP-dependent 3-hydroxy acid dehydrogenase YdfG